MRGRREPDLGPAQKSLAANARRPVRVASVPCEFSKLPNTHATQETESLPDDRLEARGEWVKFSLEIILDDDGGADIRSPSERIPPANRRGLTGSCDGNLYCGNGFDWARVVQTDIISDVACASLFDLVAYFAVSPGRSGGVDGGFVPG